MLLVFFLFPPKDTIRIRARLYYSSHTHAHTPLSPSSRRLGGKQGPKLFSRALHIHTYILAHTDGKTDLGTYLPSQCGVGTRC